MQQLGFVLALQDDIEIDLDEVLDMDTEIERREYIQVSETFLTDLRDKADIMQFHAFSLQNLLREAQAANDSVNVSHAHSLTRAQSTWMVTSFQIFVGDLLEKVKTL